MYQMPTVASKLEVPHAECIVPRTEPGVPHAELGQPLAELAVGILLNLEYPVLN